MQKKRFCACKSIIITLPFFHRDDSQARQQQPRQPSNKPLKDMERLYDKEGFVEIWSDAQSASLIVDGGAGRNWTVATTKGGNDKRGMLSPFFSVLEN